MTVSPASALGSFARYGPASGEPDMSHFGYDFFQSICSAIEGLTSSAVQANPRIFHLERADLRYAVERDLYFSLINNEPVQRQYGRTWAELRQKPLPEGASVEKSAGEFVFRHFADGRRIELRYRPSARSVLRRALARTSNRMRGRAAFGSLERSLARTAPNLRHASLFVSVPSNRFVKYLQPIIDAFGQDDVVWLSTAAQLSGTLEREGLNHVPLDAWTRAHYGAAPGSFSSVPSPGYHYILAHLRAIQHLFSLTAPKCLLVTEGNAAREETAHQAAKALSVPSVCIQQGWSPFVHNGFRNMSYTKMLVWGQGFARALQPYNPNQRFVATGSHVLDDAAGSRPPAWLAQKVNGRSVVSFFLQSPMGIVGQRAWEDSLHLVVATARQLPSTLVLVREHLAHRLKGEELAYVTEPSNVSLAPPEDCTLAELLAVSDASVSIYSTTILESIASGVPPVIYNCTSLPKFNPDVHALGAGLEVHELESAVRLIRRLLEDDGYGDSFRPGMDRFRAEFFYKIDGQSRERIVDEIRRTMEGGL